MAPYIDKHLCVVARRRTICEVLREIYWLTEDEVIRKCVVEAEKMAKRMDAKLREYKKDWDDEEWEYLDQEEIDQRVEERNRKYEEQTCLKS